MDQSSEEEVLVWVFPNHESKTSDLEKPILALPIHRIDIPEKLKNQLKVASGGSTIRILSSSFNECGIRGLS